MFFLTAFLVGLLLLPVKENFKDFTSNPPFSWAKKGEFLATKEDLAENNQNSSETAYFENVSLKNLPVVPRPKEKDQGENKLVVWAKKAVLIDAETGKVLYQDKMLEDHHIASITKVMTALVLMDIVKDWDEKVEISPYAASAGGATVHFLSGEKFKAIDLLKAMLMNSDNTAARALAEHFAGREEKFAELMNEKAKELKLRNSYFVDASGLDDERSHSCAFDVAQIAREVLRYPTILEIMQTPSHIQIQSCDEFSNVHRVGNTDELLGKYPGILGAKTGFTYNAGYCLMMIREGKNGRKVIGVVLDAGEKQRWIEMQKMLDWADENFYWSVFPKTNNQKKEKEEE